MKPPRLARWMLHRVAAMDDVLIREQGIMRAIAATLVLRTLRRMTPPG